MLYPAPELPDYAPKDRYQTEVKGWRNHHETIASADRKRRLMDLAAGLEAFLRPARGVRISLLGSPARDQ